MKELITQLLWEPGQHTFQLGEQPDELARVLFSDHDIESLTWMRVPSTAGDQTIGTRPRLMAFAETRRDKALICGAQYRGDFGAPLRDSSNRLITKEAPGLEHVSSKEKKSAA